MGRLKDYYFDEINNMDSPDLNWEAEYQHLLYERAINHPLFHETYTKCIGIVLTYYDRVRTRGNFHKVIRSIDEYVIWLLNEDNPKIDEDKLISLCSKHFDKVEPYTKQNVPF
jgi:hypothetical protein